MSAEQAVVEAAVGAVREPELDLALSELGMVRAVRTRRHRCAVVLGFPTAAWPSGNEVLEAVRDAVLLRELDVRHLIEQQPDEVAQTLRSWLADRRT